MGGSYAPQSIAHTRAVSQHGSNGWGMMGMGRRWGASPFPLCSMCAQQMPKWPFSRGIRERAWGESNTRPAAEKAAGPAS